MPLPNPTAALATSRHLHFSSELFYSLINLAVVGRALKGGGEIGAAGAEGKGVMQWLGFGSGGGGGGGHRGAGVGGGSARARGGLEGGPQR